MIRSHCCCLPPPFIALFQTMQQTVTAFHQVFSSSIHFPSVPHINHLLKTLSSVPYMLGFSFFLFKCWALWCTASFLSCTAFICWLHMDGFHIPWRCVFIRAVRDLLLRHDAVDFCPTQPIQHNWKHFAYFFRRIEEKTTKLITYSPTKQLYNSLHATHKISHKSEITVKGTVLPFLQF